MELALTTGILLLDDWFLFYFHICLGATPIPFTLAVSTTTKYLQYQRLTIVIATFLFLKMAGGL